MPEDIFQEAIGSMMASKKPRDDEPFIRRKKKHKERIVRVQQRRQSEFEVNPVFKETGKLLKRGIFGPSEQERLTKMKAKIGNAKARVEIKQLETELEELELKHPKKKGLLDKILRR